jgi:hypothetical protein
MKSRQFHVLGIISKNAHVLVIYHSLVDTLYLNGRGLLFITKHRAVESLITVVNNSSHAFFMYNAERRGQGGTKNIILTI